MRKTKRRLTRGTPGCLLGVLSLGLSVAVAVTWLDRAGWTAVDSGDLPEAFPVVVVVPGADTTSQAYLLAGETLGAFLETEPDHSFTIPIGREPDVASQLRSPTAIGTRYARGRFVTGLHVEALGTGRQLVTLTATYNGEAMMSARYEASTQELWPRQLKRWNHRTRGPATLLFSMLLTFVLLSLIVLGEWVWLRSPGAPKEAGDA